AYSATLERIKRQKGDKPRLAMAVLMWISLAERPLHVNELRHALSIKTGVLPLTSLDPGSIPSVQTLLGCCHGLVTVGNETSTIQLIHSTLQEYLHASGTPTAFENPHASIAEVCLNHLSMQSVKELSPNLTRAPEGLAFLEYASCYWGGHM
ncbi:hypothetical protein L873DRAFT_1569136, partial [Choiromyces venosus 120613-1]